ncbi:hypothetical protein JRQ81_016049 [Phrynocephalus forsythii]|uniref:Transposase n=1 Tax=Phrynocephalus forsythii TaxID=171643 RepID=A0A9Q0XVQ8_9SAUR|nr:hypothetical protein JRQ81_016049 [Phrynocephalus forsythii]
MVKKVEAVILGNRRSTMERVMAETGLSCRTVWRIIHEELHMNKVSACWVPQLLTPLQKQTCHDFSQQKLTLLERNEDNFFACLVTMDECWQRCPSLADNAPVHTAQASIVTAHGLGYELLQHPPYSPDLAPSDFFVFPEMKKPLRGRQFDNREDIIFKVEQWFSSKVEDFYKEGLKQVKKCWQKCVTLQGDYMEKNQL